MEDFINESAGLIESIINSATEADAGSEEEAATTSRTKKERVETGSDLEAALNQDAGIEEAQRQAKKEVKGEKQNRIRSKTKSEQNVKNRLRRIDLDDLDDLIGGQ